MAVKGAVKAFIDWQKSQGLRRAEEDGETDATAMDSEEEDVEAAIPEAETATLTDAQLQAFEDEDPLSLIDDAAHGQLSFGQEGSTSRKQRFTAWTAADMLLCSLQPGRLHSTLPEADIYRCCRNSLRASDSIRHHQEQWKQQQ